MSEQHKRAVRHLYKAAGLIVGFATVACRSMEPSEDFLEVAIAVRDGVDVSSVEILERHKPFESIFREPGETVLRYGFDLRIDDANGVRESEVQLQRLLVGDESWWVKGRGSSAPWFKLPEPDRSQSPSFSPTNFAERSWDRVADWLSRDAMAVQAGSTIEIRVGDDVVDRLENGGRSWIASDRHIATWTRGGLRLYMSGSEHTFTDVNMSTLSFHPDGDSLLGVTIMEGDFVGLQVVDLATGERRALSFADPPYDRPGAAWFGRDVAYEDPSSRSGEIRIWTTANGQSSGTRCSGILMGASRGELLLTGTVYRDSLLVYGPLRWCDPATGRGDVVSDDSGHHEVLAVAPSGQLIALLRDNGVLVTDRQGHHVIFFEPESDDETASQASPAFVTWSPDSRHVLFGYGAWDADHQVPGAAWSFDLEARDVAQIGVTSAAAFVEWPRWPGVPRPLVKTALYSVLILITLGGLATALLLMRLLLTRRQLSPPAT